MADDGDATKKTRKNPMKVKKQKIQNMISEVDVALEALTKLPIRRNNIESCFDSSITELNFERERLTIKVSVALPISSPVS